MVLQIKQKKKKKKKGWWVRETLIGRVEKQEDKKQGNDRKVKRQKKFNFHPFVFGWEDGKNER